MEVLWLILCGLLVWFGIDWMIDPKQSLPFDLDFLVFYRDREPEEGYYRWVRICGGLAALIGLALGAFILWTVFRQ